MLGSAQLLRIGTNWFGVSVLSWWASVYPLLTINLGADANEFRPSRWLEDEEKSRYFNANDMTFGGNGARMCIGRNLALVEVHKFLAQLLRNFDVAFENPDKPWRIHSQWFLVQSDMRMMITSRRGKAE